MGGCSVGSRLCAVGLFGSHLPLGIAAHREIPKQVIVTPAHTAPGSAYFLSCPRAPFVLCFTGIDLDFIGEPVFLISAAL